MVKILASSASFGKHLTEIIKCIVYRAQNPQKSLVSSILLLFCIPNAGF